MGAAWLPFLSGGQMSWAKLNNHELQAIRKTLMLDVSEAAELIGKVSARTWQYWESGGRSIPDDIDMEMYGLIQLRDNLIDEFTIHLLDSEEEEIEIKYYHSFDEWLEDGRVDNRVEWKIWQSAASFMFVEEGRITLI